MILYTRHNNIQTNWMNKNNYYVYNPLYNSILCYSRIKSSVKSYKLYLYFTLNFINCFKVYI